MSKELIFEESAPLAAHLARFEALQAENARWDAKQRRLFWSLAIGFVMPFLATPLMIFAPFLLPLFLILFLGGFVLCFGSLGFIIYYSTQKTDLERARQLLEILGALRADVGDESPVTIAFDGRGPLHLSKVQGEHAGKSYLPRSGEVEYVDPWLRLSVKFRDGNALSVEATTLTRQKRKPRRKGRVRTKERTAEDFKIKLRVSPRSYAGIRSNLDRLAGRSIDGTTIRAIRREGSLIRLRAIHDGGQEPGITLLRIMSLLWGHLQPYVSPKQLKKMGVVPSTPKASTSSSSSSFSSSLLASSSPSSRPSPSPSLSPSSEDAPLDAVTAPLADAAPRPGTAMGSSSAAPSADAAPRPGAAMGSSSAAPSADAAPRPGAAMGASSAPPSAGHGRAASTVKTACGCAGCGCLSVFMAFVAFIGLGFYLVTTQILESPLHGRVVDEVRRSAAVEQELGPVQSFGSVPTGRFSSREGTGEAEYSISVQGRRASGRIHVKATLLRGSWTLESLELERPGLGRMPLIRAPIPVDEGVEGTAQPR